MSLTLTLTWKRLKSSCHRHRSLAGRSHRSHAVIIAKLSLRPRFRRGLHSHRSQTVIVVTFSSWRCCHRRHYPERLTALWSEAAAAADSGRRVQRDGHPPFPFLFFFFFFSTAACLCLCCTTPHRPCQAVLLTSWSRTIFGPNPLFHLWSVFMTVP